MGRVLAGVRKIATTSGALLGLLVVPFSNLILFLLLVALDIASVVKGLDQSLSWWTNASILVSFLGKSALNRASVLGALPSFALSIGSSISS